MFQRYRPIHKCKTLNHFLLNIKKRKRDLKEWQIANDYLISFWYQKAEKLIGGDFGDKRM